MKSTRHQAADRDEPADVATVEWLRAAASEVRATPPPGLVPAAFAAAPAARRRRRLATAVPVTVTAFAVAAVVTVVVLLTGGGPPDGQVPVAASARPVAAPTTMPGGPTPAATATGMPTTTASPRPSGSASGVSTRPAVTSPPPRPSTTVPNVVGQAGATATETLHAVGFTVSRRVEDCASPDVPAGVVLAQSPAAGTQAGQQAAVTLQVAGDCATVPAVVGSPADEASNALVSAGFVVSYGGQWNCPSGYGPVTAQSPAGGTRLVRGSYVSITYVCVSGTAQPTGGGS